MKRHFVTDLQLFMYLEKKNPGPDAASSHPSGQSKRQQLPGDATDADTLISKNVSCHDTLSILFQHSEDSDTADSTDVAATCALNAVTNVVTCDMVREATAPDPTFISLINLLEEGFRDDCRGVPR